MAMAPVASWPEFSYPAPQQKTGASRSFCFWGLLMFTNQPVGKPALKPANKPARNYHSRKRVRRRAMLWLCNWQTRLSVTPSTAAISFKFMSCS